jgi:hypothetical protein
MAERLFKQPLCWADIKDDEDEKQKYLTNENGVNTLNIGKFNFKLREGQSYVTDDLDDEVIRVRVFTEKGDLLRHVSVDMKNGGKFTLMEKSGKVKKARSKVAPSASLVSHASLVSPSPPYVLKKKKKKTEPSFLVKFASGGFLEVKCIDEKGKRKLSIISKGTNHQGNESDQDRKVGSTKFYKRFAYDEDTTKVSLTAGRDPDTHVLTLKTIDKGAERTSSWLFNKKKDGGFIEYGAKLVPKIIEVNDGGCNLENMIIAAANTNPISDVYKKVVSEDVWQYCHSNIMLEGTFHLGGYWLIGNFKNKGDNYKVVLHIAADCITACYGLPGKPPVVQEVPHKHPEWLDDETYRCHYECEKAALSKHVIDMLTLTGVKNSIKKTR